MESTFLVGPYDSCGGAAYVVARPENGLSVGAAGDYGLKAALYATPLSQLQAESLVRRLKELLNQENGEWLLHDAVLHDRYKKLLGEEYDYVMTLYER